MLRRVALVRTDVSEESSAPIIRVTIIEPHCVTSQRTPFFIVNSLKTSNLTQFLSYLHKGNYYYFKYVKFVAPTAVTVKNAVF
jgi:hypothetical protein